LHLHVMAALVDKAQMGENHRVELYVGGVIWIIEDDVQAGKVKQEIKLVSPRFYLIFYSCIKSG
jgi:hypothetical protein